MGFDDADFDDIGEVLDDKKATTARMKKQFPSGFGLKVVLISSKDETMRKEMWSDARAVFQDCQGEDSDERLVEKYIYANNSIDLAKWLMNELSMDLPQLRAHIAKIVAVDKNDVLPLEDEEPNKTDADTEEPRENQCSEKDHKNLGAFKSIGWSTYTSAGEKLHQVSCKGCFEMAGRDFSISNKCPAWLCPAFETNKSICQHIYCNGCYLKKMSSTNYTKRRRR